MDQVESMGLIEDATEILPLLNNFPHPHEPAQVSRPTVTLPSLHTTTPLISNIILHYSKVLAWSVLCCSCCLSPPLPFSEEYHLT